MDPRNKENYHPSVLSSRSSNPSFSEEESTSAPLVAPITTMTPTTVARQDLIDLDPTTTTAIIRSSSSIPMKADDLISQDESKVVVGDHSQVGFNHKNSTSTSATTTYCYERMDINLKRAKFSDAETHSRDTSVSVSLNETPMNQKIVTNAPMLQQSVLATTCDHLPQRQPTTPSSLHHNHKELTSFQPLIFSKAEEMNPSRRTTMEDQYVIHQAGHWNAPDPNMIYVGVYDGHGGRYLSNFEKWLFGFTLFVQLD
jgi:hypothetical protein